MRISLNPANPIYMLILLICTTGLISCNPLSFGGDNVTAVKKEMEEVRRMIQMEIGESQADDESYCRALAKGAKPCGGPWKYLPYSTMESDEVKLRKLAERYYSLNQKYNELTEQYSDCMFISKPPVSLVDGRCKIVRYERH